MGWGVYLGFSDFFFREMMHNGIQGYRRQRDYIQQVAQICGPFGKCVRAVHDSIEKQNIQYDYGEKNNGTQVFPRDLPVEERLARIHFVDVRHELVESVKPAHGQHLGEHDYEKRG